MLSTSSTIDTYCSQHFLQNYTVLDKYHKNMYGPIHSGNKLTPIWFSRKWLVIHISYLLRKASRPLHRGFRILLQYISLFLLASSTHSTYVSPDNFWPWTFYPCIRFWRLYFCIVVDISLTRHCKFHYLIPSFYCKPPSLHKFLYSVFQNLVVTFNSAGRLMCIWSDH